MRNLFDNLVIDDQDYCILMEKVLKVEYPALEINLITILYERMMELY